MMKMITIVLVMTTIKILMLLLVDGKTRPIWNMVYSAIRPHIPHIMRPGSVFYNAKSWLS